MHTTLRWCAWGFLLCVLSPLVALRADEPASADVAQKWYRLARHLEADQQYGEAAKAIAKALELSPQSLTMLLAAARIHEHRNAWLDAVAIYEKLATVDRRFRSEHLKKVAQLEARIGRRDRALAAGREVLAAAPGNPDAFEFFAQLCFQFGANDEGLTTLRRAVRANPSDARSLLLLANALAEQFRTAESIDLLWQAFDKTNDLDGKLSIVQRLADLSGQIHQFDKLLDRLQRRRRETKDPRELTICLAQAHQQAGDDTTAREQLESLWSDDSRDTQLLQQLVKLCEATSDWTDAVRYQRQFNQVAPSRNGELRLAKLLSQAGQFEAASELYLKSATDESDPERLLQSLDSLLQHNRASDVLKVTSRLLADVGQVSNRPAPPKQVENLLHVSRWELLYREGIALAMLRRKEAAASFEAILKLNRPDDEPDAATFARRQRESSREPVRGTTPSAVAVASTAAAVNRTPFQQITAAVHYARTAALNAMNEQVRSLRSTTIWTPTDFGQCRAASQAWLLTIAHSENREKEFLAERQADWEKRRSESHVVLDWYLLQLARGNGPASFAAAKALSELPDAPLDYKWAFLQSVGQRSNTATIARNLSGQVFNVQGTSSEPTTPLTNSDFDQIIGCLAEVQRQFDDSTWANQWLQVPTLLAELRRAGRDAQAAQVYASLLHNATTPARAYAIWQEAFRIGELEPLERLARVLFPDEDPQAVPASHPLAKLSPYYATREYQASILTSVMAAQIAHNQLNKQVEVFESFVTRSLRTPRPKPRNVPAGASNAVAVQLAQQQRAYSVYRGVSSPPTPITVQWDYPVPNEYFDRPMIQLLAQMFSSHRWANKEAELCEQFRKRAESTTRTDRLYWQLGLSYLEWQRDTRKQEAVEALEKAVALAPDSVALAIELAERYEFINQLPKGLELIDSLLSRDGLPLDHDARRDAELIVLRMAQSLNRTERATLAAERLFSMNLDANMLLDVSKRMDRLGLDELATAMRNRTRNKAGNQADVLLTLMREYSSKMQTELAAEVAHQILRRTPRQSAQSQTVVVRTANGGTQTVTRPSASRGVQTSSTIRQEALRVLHQAGRLSDMIAKAEDQLEKSPSSERLLDALAEYLQAAGQKARDPEVAKRIVALQQARTPQPISRTSFGSVATPQPDEIAMMRQQLQQKDIAGAVTRLDKLLKLSPALITDRWREIDAAFHAVQHRDELLKLVEKGDRLLFEQGWTIVGNVAGEAIRNSATRERGVALLIKGLDAAPDNVGNLLVLAGATSELCRQKEIAPRIRKSIIPSDSRPLKDYWQGTRLLATSQSANHPLHSFGAILLDSCDEPEDLAELERNIDAALNGAKVWPGGRVLKGLILLRQGKPKEAERVLNAVLDEFQATMPTETRALIAQEVEGITSLQPLAQKAYETLAQNTPWPLDPSQGPIQRLLRLYVAGGQREKARDLLLKNAGQPSSVLNTNAIAEREVTRLTEISKQLRSLDFNVEAARVCRDTLANREFFKALSAATAKAARGRLDDSLRRAVMKFDADQLFEFFVGQRVAESSATAITDWALFLAPAVANDAIIRSVQVNVLEQAAQESVAASLGFRSRLAQLRKQQPQDESLTMLSLLLTIAEKSDPPLADEALPDLRQLRKPNSAASHSNIALWLVARECLRASDSKSLSEPVQRELRELGETLGERAAEAARIAERDPQNLSLAVSIYSEWTQFELTHGEPDSAEKRCLALLRAFNSAPTTPGLPATPTQFEHSARIAAQAAAHDRLALSMRAMAMPLERGPPMELFEWERFQSGDEHRTGYGSNPRDDARFCVVANSVADHVAKLEPSWRKSGLTDQQLFDWLLPLVLPSARDPEVFLYARPIPLHSVDGPLGLGASLVKAAVASGQSEKLRERLEMHASKLRGELAARVLLVELAVLENDTDRAAKNLERLLELLRPTSRRSVVESVTQAVASARRLPQPPGVVTLLLDELVAKSKAAGF